MQDVYIACSFFFFFCLHSNENQKRTHINFHNVPLAVSLLFIHYTRMRWIFFFLISELTHYYFIFTIFGELNFTRVTFIAPEKRFATVSYYCYYHHILSR